MPSQGSAGAIAKDVSSLRPGTYTADGAEVIRQEAQALALLADSLDRSFDAAVALILRTAGRVIVSGMGKAGHVGRKVAATLAATRSPAFFVHPSEAAHGDLGMIQPGDTLLMLSNSGRTQEALPLLHYMGAIGVPVVLVTAAENSPLAEMATVTLRLPQMGEACPQNIAPTTSSTMMLALGDALAIAAMRARGTSREDLIVLHPGGSIGWFAQPVGKLIHPSTLLPLVGPDAPLGEVITAITDGGKGIAGVVDGTGALIGVVTDGDLRRDFDRNIACPASELMSTQPKTVNRFATIRETAKFMTDAKINAIFVLDGNATRRPIGLVHVHDLALAG